MPEVILRVATRRIEMKINLHNLAHTIAEVAPLLGSALAGPGGAAVGQVIAAKFGGEGRTPEALHSLISNDPEAARKLKQIEADHALELQRMTLQTASQALQETLQDRAGARAREVSTAAIPSAQRDQTPAVLAYLLTLGLFIVILALLFVPLPNENAHVIWGLVSSLATVWVGAMGYYHGSSLSATTPSTAFVHHLHLTPDFPEDDPPRPSATRAAPIKLSH
jgi:hypothetical protein